MDNLLFYALIITLLYYFLVYLPAQKKPSSPRPFKSTTSQSTQTDPEIIETELGSNQTVTGSGPVEFPFDQTVLECPSPTFEDQKDLEKTLDFLIKGMADLSKEIDKI